MSAVLSKAAQQEMACLGIWIGCFKAKSVAEQRLTAVFDAEVGVLGARSCTRLDRHFVCSDGVLKVGQGPVVGGLTVAAQVSVSCKRLNGGGSSWCRRGARGAA